jgi:hypothetical protein
MGSFLDRIVPPSSAVLRRCVSAAAIALGGAGTSFAVLFAVCRVSESDIVGAVSCVAPPVVALVVLARPYGLAYRTLRSRRVGRRPASGGTYRGGSPPVAQGLPARSEIESEPSWSVVLGVVIATLVVAGIARGTEAYEEVESWIESVRQPPPAHGATSIEAGAPSCAILDNGALKCWGCYEFGLPQPQPDFEAPRPRYCPDAHGMGVDLPVVAVGLGRHAVAVSSTDGHSCAVLDDHSVKCWGINRSGELGLGDITARGRWPGEMGAHLPRVDLGRGRTARAVSAAEDHACALLDDQTVKCWGVSHDGDLGLGDTVDRGGDWNQMGSNLPAVELGPGRSALAISAGGTHTCALLDDHTVKCWGQNRSGQLGLGDPTSRGDKRGQMGAFH